MIDDSNMIDVQHVTCGLVPLMSTHLGGTPPEVDAVSFKVRQGIETELWNSFGTGSEWRLTTIEKELFFDVATFVRVEQNELDPLGLMDFLAMTALTIVEAGPERIDAIKPLWEQLNRHHASVSAHFADYFEKFEFEQRKAGLLSKAKQGSLRLFLAQIDKEIVGQCIASLQPEGAGEIDSIFVNPEFRGQRIGDKLMRAALRWFDDNGAISKSVVVIHGNEATHAFYARYGFLPRSTRLTLR